MPVYDARGGGNAHIDVVLTGLSVGLTNLGFVGDVLFPTVRVRKQSDLYYVFGDRSAWAREALDYRAPGAEANEIPGLQLSTDTYFAQEHALQIGIPDEEVENVDSPLSPFADGTELVTSRLLMGREFAIQAFVRDLNNYPAGMKVTLAGVNQWNDYANSNPISDIKTGRRAMHAQIFREPNLAVIPYQVMSQLEDHPDFIERIKYSQAGVLTMDIIATMIGIPRVIVPGLGVNSANIGQTASIGYLWGKDVVLAWVPDRAGLRLPAFGYEFVWAIDGNVQVMDRWREESRVRDVVRVRRRYDLKLIYVDGSGDTLAGYIIQNAVA